MVIINRKRDRNARPCKDGEAECVICDRPVKLNGRQKMVWVHCGGSHAVTFEEGQRLNAEGHEGADLGGQPIGSDCLRQHPELVPCLLDGKARAAP